MIRILIALTLLCSHYALGASDIIESLNNLRSQAAQSGSQEYSTAKTMLNEASALEGRLIALQSKVDNLESKMSEIKISAKNLEKNFQQLAEKSDRLELERNAIQNKFDEIFQRAEGLKEESIRYYQEAVSLGKQKNASCMGPYLKHVEAARKLNEVDNFELKPANAELERAEAAYEASLDELDDFQINVAQPMLIEINRLNDEKQDLQKILSSKKDELKDKMTTIANHLGGGKLFIERYSDISNEIKQKLLDMGDFFGGFLEDLICFPESTVVATPLGPKAINEIEPGDIVYTCEESTMECKEQMVKDVSENAYNSLVHLTIDGSGIRMTPSHPVYVKDLGVKKAKDIEVGSQIFVLDGKEIKEGTVTSLDWEPLNASVPVYNLSVENDNNYFVGENKLLVHNCNINNGLGLAPVGIFATGCAYSVPFCATSIEVSMLATAGGPAGAVALGAVATSCTAALGTCSLLGQSTLDFTKMYQKANNFQAQRGGFKDGIGSDEIRSINKKFGGSVEINGRANTALANAFNYRGFYKKCAAIVEKIVRGHLFDNGNKRTASEVFKILQDRNKVYSPLNEQQLRTVISKIARGDIKGVENIAEALKGF